jgi:tRNA (guanine-N7-)-methyltransferase
MDELLPQLQIGLPEKIPLEPKSLFQKKSKAVWLEIGFGGGEHLAAQAAQNPDIGFIGCEPFVNGVASLLDHIDAQQIKNIRIFADDARQLLDALPEASIDRCFVLFADPWPKTKHIERRFIGPLNVPRLSRILKPGAELILATDVTNLAAWSKEVMDSATNFTCAYHSTQRPTGWIQTRYEEKGIKAGHTPVYMSYRRK